MDKIMEVQRQITRLKVERWFNTELLTLNWWILLIAVIVPWVIWWKLVSKSQLREIMLHGLFVLPIITYLNEIGTVNTLWIYKYHLEPFSLRLNSMDLSALPVCYMLIYQYCKGWKKYLSVLALFSLIASFIGGYLFEVLGIYQTISWKHYYSVPIYFFIGIIGRWLTDIFYKKQ